MMTTKKGITIRTSLTAQEWQQFQARAEQEDLPASRLVARILRDYMKTREES